MPVGVMLASMSSTELTEWRAYYELAAEERDRATKKPAMTAADLRAALGHRVIKKKG
jgi:hypothetical protein